MDERTILKIRVTDSSGNLMPCRLHIKRPDGSCWIPPDVRDPKYADAEAARAAAAQPLQPLPAPDARHAGPTQRRRDRQRAGRGEVGDLRAGSKSRARAESIAHPTAEVM